MQTTNQQNTVTTTSGGQAGTVAPVNASTAFAPPTNIGVAAADALAEQVQLNSQITTLRLLPGAVSDQYLVKEGRAVASRQQTTVGFNISLNPPQRYRHAVAEVKVWIDPPSGRDPVSVMNLLPADKTYNVAKITSRQNAFGAVAVVETVNAEVSTGRSKDRLYLAKDTDTVALQFTKDKPKSPHGAEPVARSTQEHIRDTRDVRRLGPPRPPRPSLAIRSASREKLFANTACINSTAQMTHTLGYQLTNFFKEGVRPRPLSDHPLDVAAEPVAILGREILCGEHDHRDGASVRKPAELL